MTYRKACLLLGLAIAVVGGLGGCAALRGFGGRASEPTSTAILLPARTATQLVQAVPTDTAAAVAPSATALPTETASPEPTATAPVVPAATTALVPAEATAPEPTPTWTATPVPPAPTAVPKATARPKATATPTAEFEGRLVFQTTMGGEFYTIQADGTGLRRITDGVDPIWSPDGKQIAFTRWREPRGVWVVNADGSGERRVFDWSSARWPSWSPDGSQILFSRQHGGQTGSTERCFFGYCFEFPAHPHWRLARVALADGGFDEPPSPLFSLAPDWSPDGKQIVYAGEQGLVIQTVDGNVSYSITNDGRDTGPVWSPDGKRVAFTRRQHDHWEVYVVDADGRNLTRLTDTPEHPDGQPGNSAAPAWSPDGKSIAFLTDRAGKQSSTWAIWVMRANGSRQKPMFESALDGLSLEYGSVGDRGISWIE